MAYNKNAYMICKKGRMNQMSKKCEIGKMVLGTTIGVGVGLLFAPKSGKDTRRDLKKKMKELTKKVQNLNCDKAKKEFAKKIKKLDKELKRLENEKVLKKAKTKAASIKEKTDKLVKLAHEKKDEDLETIAIDLKDNGEKVIKTVFAKLEKGKPKKKSDID